VGEISYFPYCYVLQYYVIVRFIINSHLLGFSKVYMKVDFLGLII
jgi:hypothetical protein